MPIFTKTNSLDAQREACAAYIQSQRHEGWLLVPEPYDDGGFSGGNMDRPSLKQLLADIGAGVNHVEAETVRHILGLSLELGSVREVVEALSAQGRRTKIQIRVSGPHRGGVPFGLGGVLHLLKNRTYLGEIMHKGASYPGEHVSIVLQDLWDAVQTKLAVRERVGDRSMQQRNRSLLTGLIHDGLGRPMSPSHSNKQGKRYRYYITHERHRTDRRELTWRVPAHELERIVMDRLDSFLHDEHAIHQATGLEDGGAIDEVVPEIWTGC